MPLKADGFYSLITDNLPVTLNSSLLHTVSMAANVKLPPPLADLHVSQTQKKPQVPLTNHWGRDKTAGDYFPMSRGQQMRQKGL